MFDAILSNKRKGDEIVYTYEDDETSYNYDMPLSKTKTISKNYGTRLIRPNRFRVIILIAFISNIGK